MNICGTNNEGQGEVAGAASPPRKKFARRQPVPLAQLPTDLWLVEHVALALGRSDSWVYKRAAEGTLPYTKRTGGLVFIPAEVMAWLTAKDDERKPVKRTSRTRPAGAPTRSRR